ncbi:GntR family transcriptional regulator [Salicibibacter cibi]|uniref:GntR family transcriptional regulator n=1 Tax=Salicibibacter cibi TaxID=2743001 RepID=A0A7T6Z8H6_9BACI|nr:GntR family transcriptional regulator [Salicibibacter cibi]QQK78657.1 GntR family transcriptional regulator [Salicibibacter cibi]
MLSAERTRSRKMDAIVKSEPFHIQAYKQIHTYLLNKEFSPGEKLTETGLATRLGISRGPVREAIRMLLHDGLLVQKGSHVYVYEPNFNDVIDLYRCRERLESLAAELAAEYMTNDAKKKLFHFVNQTETALNNNEPDKKIASLNKAFHEHIVHSSKNGHLIQFMDLIHSKNNYMRNVLLSDRTRKWVFIDEHRQIAEAISEGKKEKAGFAMKEHIQKDLVAWKQMLQYSSEEEG